MNNALGIAVVFDFIMLIAVETGLEIFVVGADVGDAETGLEIFVVGADVGDAETELEIFVVGIDNKS